MAIRGQKHVIKVKHAEDLSKRQNVNQKQFRDLRSLVSDRV